MSTFKDLSDLAAAFGLPTAQATAQVAAQVVKILQAAVDPVEMKNEIFICRHESKSGNFLFLRIV